MAQYWNGSTFITNTLDNCTTVPVPTSSSGMVFGTLLVGAGGFILSKPEAGNTGFVAVTISSPIWLQYAWSGSTASNPTGRAAFGIFMSALIYRRENY